MPILLSAQRWWYLRLTRLPVVQDEVHDLHGCCHGKLCYRFLLLGLRHLAHLVSGLDVEDDTPHDSLGSNLVGGANHHSHQCHYFLVDDDLGIL